MVWSWEADGICPCRIAKYISRPKCVCARLNFRDHTISESLPSHRIRIHIDDGNDDKRHACRIVHCANCRTRTHSFLCIMYVHKQVLSTCTGTTHRPPVELVAMISTWRYDEQWKIKCTTSVAFTSTRPPINSPLSLSIVSQPSHLIRLLSNGNITFPTARWCQHRKFQYGDVEPSLQLVFIPHSHDIKSCAFSAKQLTRLSRLKMNTIFICVIAMNGFAQYLDACNYIRIHIWLFYVCKLAKDKPTIAAAAARSIGDERKR